MRKIINFKKSEYVFLRVIPILGIRNKNNRDLAENINRSLLKMNKFEKEYTEEGKFKYLNLNSFANVTYYISLSKKEGAKFIFKVPKEIESVFTAKLRESFEECLVQRVDYIEKQYKFKRYLGYSKEDTLSLHIDLRQKEFVNNLIENIDILNGSEDIEIKFEFFKIGRIGDLQFRDYIKATEEKIKKGESLKLSEGVLNSLGNALLNTGKELINSILMTNKGNNSNKINDLIYLMSNKEEFKLSNATIKKKASDILLSSIEIKSTSKKAIDSVASSFNLLSEDNSLTLRKNRRENIMSVNEVGQFFQLPGAKELLDKYRIEYILHKEVKIPTELKEGSLNLGSVSYRNSNENIFMSDKGSNKFLPFVVIGPTRSGKTSLIQNLIKNAIENGDSVVFFDFIETCRASNEILHFIPREKTTILDLSKKVEGLDFNEIKIVETMEPKKKYKMLKLKANGILALIDSCNLTNNEELKSQMRKIFMSIVLITLANGLTLKIAIDALQNYDLRRNLIKNIPKDLKEYLEDSIFNIKALDEKSKNGVVVGTKTHLVNSILNRLYALQMNEALEEMLNKDSRDNINFIDEMQKGRFIVIQIPDSVASTNIEKDIICSYYFNKIWFALQQRAELIGDENKKRLLLMIDEIYQLENTEILVKQRINQIAKYYCKFLISCHSVGQISNLKKELLSADASYTLICGSDASSLKELGLRFKNFKEDDLINLKQYHAINSLKSIENGYVECISKLPPLLR